MGSVLCSLFSDNVSEDIEMFLRVSPLSVSTRTISSEEVGPYVDVLWNVVLK